MSQINKNILLLTQEDPTYCYWKTSFSKKHPYLLTLFLLFPKYLLLSDGKQSWMDIWFEQVNLNMLRIASYIPAFRWHINIIEITNPKQQIPIYKKEWAQLWSLQKPSLCCVAWTWVPWVAAGKHRGPQPASPSSSQHKPEPGSTRSVHEGQSCSHSVPAMRVLQLIIRQCILRSIRSLLTRDICFRIAKVSVAFSKTDQVSSTEIIKYIKKTPAGDKEYK